MNSIFYFLPRFSKRFVLKQTTLKMTTFATVHLIKLLLDSKKKRLDTGSFLNCYFSKALFPVRAAIILSGLQTDIVKNYLMQRNVFCMHILVLISCSYSCFVYRQMAIETRKYSQLTVQRSNAFVQ